MLIRVGLLTAAVLALGAACAQARIVIDRSIAGVSLGATRAEAQATLGPPDRDWTPEVPSSDNSSYWDYQGGLRLGFRDQGDVVTLLYTTSRTQRTASGLGVGSRRGAVRRHLNGEICSRDSCMTGDDRLGARNTVFAFGRGGRVRSVSVYVRPDTYRP